MPIRRLTLILLASLAPLHAAAEEPPTPFAKRLALATEVEREKEASEYFQSRMYPAIGPVLSSAMKECLSHPGASTSRFAIVADMTRSGEFVRVAYEPHTDTAACLAAALKSIHAPAPPACTPDG